MAFGRLRVVLIALSASILLAGCALHGSAPGSALNAPAAVRNAAPTLQTLYTFNSYDGADPQGPMVVDASGNIYGAAHDGGPGGGGVAFELVKGSSGYKEDQLYDFRSSGGVGANPGALTFDADGNLWGQTSAGVVELTPAKPYWKANLVYAGCAGGASENFDTRVTPHGKDVFAACTAISKVVKISPAGSGFRTAVIHKFPDNNSEQVYPNGGLVVDASGNVVGTSWSYAGSCCAGSGPTYELLPSGKGYTIGILFSEPTSYGVSIYGPKKFETGMNIGAFTCGHIYEAEHYHRQLHVRAIVDGVCKGRGTPLMDRSGNVYFSGGSTAVKLVPAEPKYVRQIIATVSSLVQPLWIDSTGTMYGATTADGAHASGTVFRIVAK